MTLKVQAPLRSSRGWVQLGWVCLLSLLLLPALWPSDAIAAERRRDQFPGRRQGGGTHWVYQEAATQAR